MGHSVSNMNIGTIIETGHDITVKGLKVIGFTCLGDREFTFSPKLNVITGESGSGKTHLLNVIYAALIGNRRCSLSMKHYATKVTEALIDVFLVDKIGDLVNLEEKNASVHVSMMHEAYDAHFSFGKKSELVKIIKQPSEKISLVPVFIMPTKVLHLSPWFNSFYVNYKLNIEHMIYNTLNLCCVPPLKNIPEEIEKISNKINEIINGRYEMDMKDGRFYLVRGKHRIPSALCSSTEDFFGVLQLLIENGALIYRDIKGILIIDKPELVISKEYQEALTEILLDLSKMGIQIFVASNFINLSKIGTQISLTKN